MNKLYFHFAIFFAALFFISPVHLYSQDSNDYLHGFVVDQNNEPLIGANIVAMKNEAFSHGSSSDLEGAFEINSNADFFEISYIGFPTIQLTKKELTSTPLVQLNGGINLETVVVLGYSCPFGCRIIGCGGTMTSTQCNGVSVTEEIEEKKENPFPLTEYSFLRPYPNPTIDYIYVNTLEGVGTLHLFSSNGSLLQSQRVSNTTSVFDLNDYPAGIYVVTYENGKELISEQIIKGRL